MPRNQTGRRSSAGPAALVAGLAFTAGALGADPALARDEPIRAQLRTTAHGVAHVKADDYAGAGFGLGYAYAREGLCEIAGRWVTVNGERSRYFGPDGVEPQAMTPHTNLQSDFFWKRILDAGVIEAELAKPAPLGPEAGVREMVRGYVAGYNRHLQEVGVDNIPDARCRGAAWVRPITEKDVYLRALHWNLFLSSVQLLPELTSAAPPSGQARGQASAPMRLADHAPPEPGHGPGSNMIAVGRDASQTGQGMLFANPHWFWEGPERFFEAQLTVPGKMNAYGATVPGLPFVMLGTTDKVAWSHTVSTPRRYTVYELQLVTGEPTAYLYDGARRAMTPRKVSVSVKETDGTLGTREHTFWETHNALVVESRTFPWTAAKAYALRDVNVSLRWMNQTFAMGQARSLKDLDAAGQKYLGIGWLNTIAVDQAGQALYADRTAVPHVTDAQLSACVTSELGRKVLESQRVPVMDGWRGACEWGVDADAPAPGIFGSSKLPQLARTDYVSNSNDSYWVNNLHHPLEGYPLIMGDERTMRSLRARSGLAKIEHRLDGSDGYPGRRFTLDLLEKVTMDNRVFSAVLWRDEVVKLCQGLPTAEVGEGCLVLASWDLTEDVDAEGAVLWRRFFEKLSTGRPQRSGAAWKDIFVVAFDPKDPMNTPRGLNTANPAVATALTSAIADLRASNIPLAASLRHYQYIERDGVRYPVPGGPPEAGQYNYMLTRAGFVPGKGWPDVESGSSFVMWLQFGPEGPSGRTVLANSQANRPGSPLYVDQTRRLADKWSKPILFQEKDILADPDLAVTSLCSAGHC